MNLFKLLLFAFGITLSGVDPVRAAIIKETFPASIAHAVSIPSPETMNFIYETVDGSERWNCSHEVANADSQDWDVKCQDGSGHYRKYSVHLWLSRYNRVRENLTSYELLYWVTDWSDAQNPKSQSVTIWHHIKNVADLAGIDASIGVDGDLAALQLKMRL